MDLQLKSKTWTKSYLIICIEMSKQNYLSELIKESYFNLIATLNLEILTQPTSSMNKNIIFYAKRTQIQKETHIGSTSKFSIGSHSKK